MIVKLLFYGYFNQSITVFILLIYLEFTSAQQLSNRGFFFNYFTAKFLLLIKVMTFFMLQNASEQIMDFHRVQTTTKTSKRRLKIVAISKEIWKYPTLILIMIFQTLIMEKWTTSMTFLFWITSPK